MATNIDYTNSDSWFVGSILEQLHSLVDDWKSSWDHSSNKMIYTPATKDFNGWTFSNEEFGDLYTYKAVKPGFEVQLHNFPYGDEMEGYEGLPTVFSESEDALILFCKDFGINFSKIEKNAKIEAYL